MQLQNSNILFKEIADAKIEVHRNLVVLKPNKDRKSPNAPMGLMCAAFMIRHALSFITQHHVPCRAIMNANGNFVCYIAYVGNTFTRAPDGEYGADSYLRSVGWGDQPFDFIDSFQTKAAQHDGVVRKWSWRTIRHKTSRIRRSS